LECPLIRIHFLGLAAFSYDNMSGKMHREKSAFGP
jgi:hypothetical protein